MAVASWTAGAAGQPQISGTDALAYQALVREYIAGDVPGAIARLNARPIPLGEQVSENYWTLFNLNERRAAALLESEAGFASSLLPVSDAAS